MSWLLALLALVGAVYHVATTKSDAAWWSLIAVLGVLFVIDVLREWREYRAALHAQWAAEDEDGQA